MKSARERENKREWKFAFGNYLNTRIIGPFYEYNYEIEYFLFDLNTWRSEKRINDKNLPNIGLNLELNSILVSELLAL